MTYKIILVNTLRTGMKYLYLSDFNTMKFNLLK